MNQAAQISLPTYKCPSALCDYICLDCPLTEHAPTFRCKKRLSMFVFRQRRLQSSVPWISVRRDLRGCAPSQLMFFTIERVQKKAIDTQIGTDWLGGLRRDRHSRISVSESTEEYRVCLVRCTFLLFLHYLGHPADHGRKAQQIQARGFVPASSR